MIKKIFVNYLCLVAFGCSYAKGEEDIKTNTLDAYRAYKEYSMGQPAINLKKKSVEYSGCAGDISKFECVYQVNVIIHYNTTGLAGSCEYIHNNTKFGFSGFADDNGNLVFSEYLNNGNLNYQFYGIHDESGIRGVWSKGNGKKQFAMSVTPSK
jgi:hypothetical protein